jgi:hypothetical protein
MSIKVFNLQCASGHLFEGWFSSHDDYEHQHSCGLLCCPICQSADITKMPTAPHINSSRTSEPMSEAPTQSPVSAASTQMAQIQAQMLAQMRHVITSAEDVGSAFAREALAIHEGEAPARSIRGQATEQERQELMDEGIAFMTVPAFLSDDRLQ